MKWKRKYNIDIQELHEKNMAGMSLVDLAKEYKIPRTTLNRYLADAGFPIFVNRKNTAKYWIPRMRQKESYTCTSAWKRALILRHGYKCLICGYDKIVEAHHIIPQAEGGKTTVSNGILLCPNHHAEAHAEILNIPKALLKRGELLENPEEDNQQPSHEDNQDSLAKVMEGSETSSRAEAVMEPRAPRSRRKTKNEFLGEYQCLRDMI
jgi:5-methylcytosine-specific restriction endonuclease McrA